MGWEDFLLHKKEGQNKLQGHFSTTGLSVLPCSPPALPALGSPPARSVPFLALRPPQLSQP